MKSLEELELTMFRVKTSGDQRYI